MSKKKNKKVKDEGQKNDDVKEENQQQKGGEDGGAAAKKDNNSNGGNAVVLKIDLHCEGCASKIVKCIRGFEGAEAVKVDGGSGKITVTGKVDPVKLRDKLEEKTHKKVELLSPVPKKDKAKNDDGGDGKEETKKDNKPKDNNKNKNKNKKDDKNSKEPPVTTAVLKVSLHCEGCIQKIHKIVTKTKGYQEIKVDKQKDLVTVKGAMDMKDLVESLKKHLKRDVEIVPPKKDDKKEKGGGGGGGGKPAGGEGGGGGGEKMEGSKMQQQQQQQMIPIGPLGYDYPSSSPFLYGAPVPAPAPAPAPAYIGDPYQFHYHAPQLFSDENPNACSVM